MQDRNGNTTSITYDGLNRISNISDPTSRHLYFHYGNSIYLQQVTSVTSDAGIITYYQYDQNGNLVQVAYPDSSSINFEYDSDALITAVRDKDGKLLETATETAQRLAQKPAGALRASKRLMSGATREQIAQAMKAENQEFSSLVRSADAKEALTAFLEKRPPDFTRTTERPAAAKASRSGNFAGWSVSLNPHRVGRAAPFHIGSGARVLKAASPTVNGRVVGRPLVWLGFLPPSRKA